MGEGCRGDLGRVSSGISVNRKLNYVRADGSQGDLDRWHHVDLVKK